MDYSKNCYYIFVNFYHQLILLWQSEESKLMAIGDGAALGIGNKLSPSHISMYKHLLCKAPAHTARGILSLDIEFTITYTALTPMLNVQSLSGAGCTIINHH